MVQRILSVFAALALSTSALAVQPNLFSCKSGDAAIEVGYTSSSFAGVPTFSALRDGTSLIREEGNKVVIHQEQTTLGTFVSAVVTRRFAADAPGKIYGLFIPFIELGEHNETVFSTYYVEGTSGGYRATPAVTQQMEESVKVDCEGRHVYF